ncbi:MAG: hypothetical protein IKH88_18235 [Prevotella sp.]|nr:hypothetical protein [Prevotella sp.]
MKKTVFCLVLMASCVTQVLAQQNVVVNASDTCVTIPTAQVEYIDFRKGNDAIAVDFAYVTALNNGFKLLLVPSDDVTAYKWYCTTKAKYESKNDDDWFELLKKEKKTDINGLELIHNSPSANTEYVIMVLPMDEEGNYGRMAKCFVKTPKKSAQPLAEISNVSHGNNLLKWNVDTKDGAKAYYMMVNVGDFVYKGDTLKLKDKKDVVIAFLINRHKESLPRWTDFNSFRKVIDELDSHFDIITWAMDAEGNMSGTISRYHEEPVVNAMPPTIDEIEKAKRYSIPTQFIKELMDESKELEIWDE